MHEGQDQERLSLMSNNLSSDDHGLQQQLQMQTDIAVLGILRLGLACVYM